MALALWQTGNTDDSRKCSHGNVNECAPPLSQAHRNVNVQLLTSIHPSMVLLCQVLPICLWSSKCLSGGRFGEKDEERLRMLCLYCWVFFFRCGSNPCLLCIVNWAFLRVSGTKEKWRCAHFFVSLYRVVTGAASACLIWRTHRHLLHTHFYTGDVPGQAVFYDHTV